MSMWPLKNKTRSFTSFISTMRRNSNGFLLVQSLRYFWNCDNGTPGGLPRTPVGKDGLRSDLFLSCGNAQKESNWSQLGTGRNMSNAGLSGLALDARPRVIVRLRQGWKCGSSGGPQVK